MKNLSLWSFTETVEEVLSLEVVRDSAGLARVKKPVEKNRVFLLVFIGFFQRNFEKNRLVPAFFKIF